MQTKLAYNALSMMRQMASLLVLAKEIARAASSMADTPSTDSSQRMCVIPLILELDVQFVQSRSTLGGRFAKAVSSPPQRKLV